MRKRRNQNPTPAGRPETNRPTASRRRRRDIVAVAVVFAAAWGAFANSLPNGFVLDDVDIIQENARLDDPWDVRVLFGTSYWHDADPTASLFRPLTIMSFAVDRAVFGPGPFGVHLMNVTANAVVAALVYVFVLRLGRRRNLALITALVFSLHPVHTEVVANGVGRAELYAAVVMLAAALCHLSHSLRQDGTERRGRRTPGRLLAAVMLYFVSMLFKESAAILPALLFLMDGLVVHRDGLRAMLARSGRYLIYAPALIAFLVIRASVVELALPAQQEITVGATTVQRTLFSAETMLRYVGQLCYPMWLCADHVDYTRPIRPALSDWSTTATVAGWFGICALSAWLARGKRLLPLFAMAWFLLAMLPVSNLIVPIGTTRADRLLYLPSLGFALFAAYWIAWLAGVRRRSAVALLAIVLSFYAWRTVTRNGVWRSPETLWTATVADNPGSALAWSALGDIHRAKREHGRAADAYRRSVELREGAGFFHPDARVGHGQMLQHLGDPAGAESQYRAVLGRRPNHYAGLINLGTLLLGDAADHAEAVDLFRRAVRVDPGGFEGHANLAQAMLIEGRAGDALAAVEIAIRLNPAEPRLRDIKAECLSLLGRPEAARRAARKAEELRR